MVSQFLMAFCFTGFSYRLIGLLSGTFAISFSLFDIAATIMAAPYSSSLSSFSPSHVYLYGTPSFSSFSVFFLYSHFLISYIHSSLFVAITCTVACSLHIAFSIHHHINSSLSSFFASSFSAVSENIGILHIIVKEMMARDVGPFLAVSFVYLGSFSVGVGGFFSKERVTNFENSIIWSFLGGWDAPSEGGGFLIQRGNYEVDDEGSASNVGSFYTIGYYLFAVFILLSNIVLMNLLIAMMGVSVSFSSLLPSSLVQTFLNINNSLTRSLA
jgi:hypothetical protein